MSCFFFFQAEDGIRYFHVTGVQTCALPICRMTVGRRERPCGETFRGGARAGARGHGADRPARRGLIMERGERVEECGPQKGFAAIVEQRLGSAHPLGTARRQHYPCQGHSLMAIAYTTLLRP